MAAPTLAARAIRAGLVDEDHLFVTPMILGGGIPVLSRNLRLKLALVSEHRLASGLVALRYRPQG